MRRFIFVVMMIVCAGVAFAVEPDEVLSDPTLEARARDISKELRCLVCRNEHIDASDAAIAKDLRLLVRERLLAGDSDAEVIAYIVDRYGEFVLLRPPLSRGNILLYLAGPFALLIGFGFWLSMGRKEVQPQITLSKAEEKRLKDLLDE